MARISKRCALALTTALVALAVPAVASADAPAIKTVPVTIKATQPDDEGHAVALDGGVTYPLSGCPCPGVIINHGFLGSWHDSTGTTEQLARNGYVVLRYSSR